MMTHRMAVIPFVFRSCHAMQRLLLPAGVWEWAKGSRWSSCEANLEQFGVAGLSL